MLKTKIFGEKRRHKKVLEDLKQRGVIIEDQKHDISPRDVESIIRKFIESAGWDIMDFPDFLKLMNITLPVKIHTFMGLNDRLKFYEVEGADDNLNIVCGDGDLQLICARAESNPIIKVHAQLNGLAITRDYVIGKNLGDSQKIAIYGF